MIPIDDRRGTVGATSATSTTSACGRRVPLIAYAVAVRRSLVVPIALILLVAACGSDGGSGSSDDTTSTSAPPQEEVELALTSPAFADGDPIPDQYSWDGGNLSPPLAWEGVPSGAEELAITVVDPDAANFVHWVLTGITTTTTEVVEGETPSGAVEGLNQFGEVGWGGPAPPPGEPHTYLFTLHVLSGTPDVDAATPGPEAVAFIEDLTTDRAELRASFETG